MIRQEKIFPQSSSALRPGFERSGYWAAWPMRGGSRRGIPLFLFFVPGTTQLDPDAQQIVKQAAYNARIQKLMRIEIASRPTRPVDVRLVEGRMTQSRISFPVKAQTEALCAGRRRGAGSAHSRLPPNRAGNPASSAEICWPAPSGVYLKG
jgi:hypothetical protein